MKEIDRLVGEVASSPSSIYTKEDVLALLERARTTGTAMSAEDLIGHLEDIGDTIDSFDPSEVLMMDTAEFYMDGDRVILETVSIDAKGLARVLRDLAEDCEDELSQSGGHGHGVAFTVKAKKRRRKK